MEICMGHLRWEMSYGDHSYICMSRGGHLDPALSMEKPNYFISLKSKELI